MLALLSAVLALFIIRRNDKWIRVSPYINTEYSEYGTIRIDHLWVSTVAMSLMGAFATLAALGAFNTSVAWLDELALFCFLVVYGIFLRTKRKNRRFSERLLVLKRIMEFLLGILLGTILREFFVGFW